MDRRLGPEAARAYRQRVASGFIAQYLSGEAVLDIGYRGGDAEAQPITARAIGVELDYPGYDGLRLPFADDSQDAVFSSHCLEHIDAFEPVLLDWYRVLKIGGFLVIAVPHQYLYERKATLPSRFNPDHKRLYTPARLLAEVERVLPLDGYRVRSLRDNDDGFDYAKPPDEHAAGCYEIELVLQKITRPAYAGVFRLAPLLHGAFDLYTGMLREVLTAQAEARADDARYLRAVLLQVSPPPYAQITARIPAAERAQVDALLREIITTMPFDATWYAAHHDDVGRSVERLGLDYARTHFVEHGYQEGRAFSPRQWDGAALHRLFGVSDAALRPAE